MKVFISPQGLPQAIIQRSEFPYPSVSVCSLPAKLWLGHLTVNGRPVDGPRITPSVEEQSLQVCQDPIDEVRKWNGTVDLGLKSSQLALYRAYLGALIVEDPYGRLEAREIQTLAHQQSLIEHIVSDLGRLGRVLVADEVGLGKTIEASLLIKHFLSTMPSGRVLYLTPARLVTNAARELLRAGLRCRVWMSNTPDDLPPAEIQHDPLVVASIHRAAIREHKESIIKSTWNMVVVDECHHLSAWGAGGSSTTQKYSLVKGIIEKLREPRRVLFLSGTPHQGNETRFSNLLDLLEPGAGRDPRKVRGKVIHRLKEDITDWDGNLLFPTRDVRPFTPVDLGDLYQSWLKKIHFAFDPSVKENADPDAHQRVKTWKQAQAMQWAASSVQAGLGYLVRQAIRAEMTSSDPVLREALLAIRPYRHGPLTESPTELFARIRHSLGLSVLAEDDEDFSEEIDANEIPTTIPNPAAFREALSIGVSLAQSGAGDEKWKLLFSTVLRDIGKEKVVLFAQPLETVQHLADWIQKNRGTSAAIIVGGQDDSSRERQVSNFRNDPNCQFLISSRAGGEGINLQVARRLVHIDVPWNPMDMEQRVGRVHRFGSREQIIVDTLIVKDSREEHCYRVARQKLRLVASSIADDPQRFEAIFSRIMALIPAEEIFDLLGGKPYGSLDERDEENLGAHIANGFRQWNNFHAEYSAKLKTQIDPGLAKASDLSLILTRILNAEPVSGFKQPQFKREGGDVVTVYEDAQVFQLDRRSFCVRESAGIMPQDQSGFTAERFGLNHSAVISLLGESLFNSNGAGAIRMPRTYPLPEGISQRLSNGVLLSIFIGNRLRPSAQAQSGYEEINPSMLGVLLTADGEHLRLSGAELLNLLRGLVESGSMIRRPELRADWVQRAAELQTELQRELTIEWSSATEKTIAGVFPWAVLYLSN